jgi:hypothetical protein
MSIKTYKIIETILLLITLVFYILAFTIDNGKTYHFLALTSLFVMVLIGKIIKKKEKQLKEVS